MELILYNGTITTMEEAQPRAEAVAVCNGVIAAVGTNEAILSLKTADTAVVDLEGKTVLPGFHDSHMHLLSLGYAEEKLELSAVRSLDELIREGRRYVEKNPSVRWIHGRGWNNELWEDKTLPTRYDLDRISAEIPIVLARACNRMLVANSRALAVARITPQTPQPPRGHFDTDDNGMPLGCFWDEGRELIWRATPPMRPEDMRRLIQKAGSGLLRYGITSVHSDDFEAVTEKDFDDLMSVLVDIDEKGELPVRLFAQCRWTTPAMAERFLDRGYRSGFRRDRFCVESLKLLADGVLGTRSALLSRPYEDMPETSGHAEHSQEELNRLTLLAHRRKTAVSIHAIGDQGLDMALNAIAYAKKMCPETAVRHAVIHCQITRPDQFERMRLLGVTAHLQPIFIDTDQHIVPLRVGEERAKTSYCWRTIVTEGIPYAFGSDSPVCTSEVTKGIYCAVTRRDLAGNPPDGWMPEQKLTVRQAVHGYTLGAAFAAGAEDRLGSITVGKQADLAVLSDDIFAVPHDAIKDLRVRMTVLGGRVVYRE